MVLARSDMALNIVRLTTGAVIPGSPSPHPSSLDGTGISSRINPRIQIQLKTSGDSMHFPATCFDHSSLPSTENKGDDCRARSLDKFLPDRWCTATKTVVLSILITKEGGRGGLLTRFPEANPRPDVLSPPRPQTVDIIPAKVDEGGIGVILTSSGPRRFSFLLCAPLIT